MSRPANPLTKEYAHPSKGKYIKKPPRKAKKPAAESRIIWELGEFELTSPTIRISDPICDTELDSIIDFPAVPGTWKCLVNCIRKIYNQKDKPYIDIAISELIAYHQDFPEVLTFHTHWRKRGTIKIYSGMAGIFEPTHYKDDSVINFDLIEDIDDKWLTQCELALHRKSTIGLGIAGAGTIPFGVVSKSGVGDGRYFISGVAYPRKKPFVAVRIRFLSDYEKRRKVWRNKENQKNPGYVASLGENSDIII